MLVGDRNSSENSHRLKQLIRTLPGAKTMRLVEIDSSELKLILDSSIPDRKKQQERFQLKVNKLPAVVLNLVKNSILMQ